MTAVLTAIIYLGLSNYCLSYAVMTGEAHCLPTTPAHSHVGHEGDADQGDHEHAPADHHDSSDGSGLCCTQVAAVAVPSAPQLLAAVTVPADFLYVIVAETTVAIETLFRRTDNGPPKPAEQDVSLAYRAPRAPPILA